MLYVSVLVNTESCRGTYQYQRSDEEYAEKEGDILGPLNQPAFRSIFSTRKVGYQQSKSVFCNKSEYPQLP